MTLNTSLKQVEIWTKNRSESEENPKLQDLVESLEMNKEIKRLEKYLGEHILLLFNKIETQIVGNVIQIFKRKYGRTQVQNLEQLVND